jgi:hypothetical protein
VARWRTSVALATVALVATACGQTAGSSEPAASKTTPSSRPQLAPTGQSPLTVKGTGFRPHEQVHLVAKGLRSASADATADSSGIFVASFRGLKSCDSVTVTAVGSKGSRTEFNLSQIVCLGS